MTDTHTTLRGYLEADLARLHARRKRTAIGGIVLVVLTFGYMSWLHGAIKEFSQPDTLALTVTGYVEAGLPELEKSTEAMIRAEAPKLVQHIADTVSREVPTLLRDMIERMVLEYSRSLAKYAVAQYGEAFQAVLDGARGDLQQAVATDIDTDRDRHVVQALEKQIAQAVEKASQADVQGEPLFVKLEQSHTALVNLNKRLDRIASSDNRGTTRKEQLERRFLSTFWRFAQQEYPDVKQ